jgi:hypothetical protein
VSGTGWTTSTSRGRTECGLLESSKPHSARDAAPAPTTDTFRKRGSAYVPIWAVRPELTLGRTMPIETRQPLSSRSGGDCDAGWPRPRPHHIDDVSDIDLDALAEHSKPQHETRMDRGGFGAAMTERRSCRRRPVLRPLAVGQPGVRSCPYRAPNSDALGGREVTLCLVPTG